MSQCINPNCKCSNPDDTLFCQKCGSELLLAGRYRVTSLLSGKGGFADTYEVLHHNVPKVMKVLKQQNQKAMELFKREFQVLQQSNHPGIPKAEDFFEFTTRDKQTSLSCLVMEKIVGKDLEEYIKEIGRPIDEKCAWEWLSQLAQILAEIHHQQLLHRDIKPSNIILQPDGQLVLIDFGAVKQIPTIQPGGQSTCIYTPGYAAPEQERGHPGIQSDFFSLGRTFVYLLTGKDPTVLGNPHTNGLDWHPYTSHLSPALVQFIDRLMEPSVENRPANAQEILAYIEKGRQPALISPPPPMPDPVANKPWKILLPLLLLLLGGAIWGAIALTKNPNSQTAANNPTASPVPTNSNLQCSTSTLVKKSGNLYGVIEVGSTGIKTEVIQELAVPNEDNLKFKSREDTETKDTTPSDPQAQAESVSAVKDKIKEIQERFQIPCEQIVIYGSSGLAQESHKDALAAAIGQETGRKVKFISVEEEAILAFDGIVPSARRNQVVTIDIGSGNTKGAYLESTQPGQPDKYTTFGIPFGTKSFTKIIDKRPAGADFITTATTEKDKLLIPEIRNLAGRKPGLQNLPRVYLAGGISWALFTLVRPCQPEQTIETQEERIARYGRLRPEDINTFYNNAIGDQKTLFKPDLSQCTPEQRKIAEVDIAKIQKIFKRDNLIAGAEVLRALASELNFAQKERIFFARESIHALPIGYLKQQLENLQ
ncbi:protein kinase domain-containing protein [Merismopedia glauca]|uniref:non-specific serine/threonine protein kinase n=1 Tax=Merismopedia glauca CCAP 1448/3 TaxID=1296344 RepID=A0A2T1C1B0_9CYAN|nr:protein kinase [Merismopedia glauca]PSB02065.1 serine/threonine protein kinase [Merismopedia glauca CCAP 1448/3]